jgi:hypothetical protein
MKVWYYARGRIHPRIGGCHGSNRCNSRHHDCLGSMRDCRCVGPRPSRRCNEPLHGLLFGERPARGLSQRRLRDDGSLGEPAPQKYQFKGTVVCNNMPLPDAQAFVENRLYALVAENKQVFQTGWTFGGAPPATSSAAPAQPYSSVAAPVQSGPVQTGNVPPRYGRYDPNGNPYRDGAPPPPAPYGSNPYGAYPYGTGPYGSAPYGTPVPCTGYGCR